MMSKKEKKSGSQKKNCVRCLRKKKSFHWVDPSEKSGEDKKNYIKINHKWEKNDECVL